MRSMIDAECSCHLRIDRCPGEALRRAGITPLCIVENNGCIEMDVRAREEEIPSMLERFVENGIRVRICTTREIELDEIFERLVAHADTHC
jgi:hypothetical protein